MVKTPAESPHERDDELKYHGLHACETLWHERPQAIIRVYLIKDNKDLMKSFAGLLKWCADKKKAYHLVDEEALSKVTGSVHHEGICILARRPPLLTEAELLERVAKTKRCCLIYLDGVENPHNIGSIMRAAAHFGVPCLIGRKGQLPAMTGAAVRVAEGGGEFVRLAAIEQPQQLFKALRQHGFQIVTTSSHKGEALYKQKLSAKVLFVLGAEVHGVSSTVADNTDLAICIPGTGAVESLNVAMATGLLMAEHWRQHPQASQVNK